MLTHSRTRDEVLACLTGRNRSDLFGCERHLSKRRENLRNLARADFNHDDIPRPSRIATFLNGECLGTPIQHLSNRFDFSLSDVARQVRYDRSRPPRCDFSTLADLNSAQLFYRTNLSAEATAAGGIEAVPLELQLNLRTHSLQQGQKAPRQKIKGRRG